jgi:hypothetical protein
MTCPTCDTLRAELQRAREAWARLRPFLPLKGSGPQWEHSEHYRAAKDVDAALSSTPPPCKHDKGREILANGVKGLERCLDCGVYLEATPPRALCTKCGKGHSAPGWCEAEEATQRQEFVQSLAPASTAPPQGPGLCLRCGHPMNTLSVRDCLFDPGEGWCGCGEDHCLGDAPQGPCPHGVTKTEMEHCCVCDGCFETEPSDEAIESAVRGVRIRGTPVDTAPTYTAEEVERAIHETFGPMPGESWKGVVSVFRAALRIPNRSKAAVPDAVPSSPRHLDGPDREEQTPTPPAPACEVCGKEKGHP